MWVFICFYLYQDIKTEEVVTNDHVCAVDVDVHQGIPVLQIRYVKTE